MGGRNRSERGIVGACGAWSAVVGRHRRPPSATAASRTICRPTGSAAHAIGTAAAGEANPRNDPVST